MVETDGVIRAICPQFACRVCRTRTGWPHQSWCEQRETTVPRCADCRYYHAGRQKCVHPTRGKGGIFAYGEV